MKWWKDFDKLVNEDFINKVEELKDDDLGVIIKVLQESAVLEKLVLRDNYITLADEKFSKALAKNQTIQYLDFDGAKIGAEGAKHLADALKSNQSLKEIFLGYNQICDEGAKSLAGALEVNESIQSLYLSSNRIGAEGAEHLADALRFNRSLENIWLGNNRIGDIGAECFADALAENRSVQSLDLSENNIGCEGAQSLASSIKLNESIRRVLLDGNCIKDSGAKSIADALQYNISIEEVKLTGNPISRDSSVLKRVHDIIDDPGRRKLRNLIRGKDDEIASKDQQIALLKEDLESQHNEIESLKVRLAKSQPIIDTVDLTSEESEHTSKRPRKENGYKSSLAIQHQSNQKITQIKQEKNSAETNLKSVQEEKQIVESNLEEVREDLDDAHELVGQQSLATNIWQGRFDELVSLVEAGQADGAAIASIRNRSLASGS